MSFSSLSEFLAMGGHGLYVWLSYGAALIMVLYNVISVRIRRRRFFQHVRDRQRREAMASVRPGPDGGAVVTGESNGP